jgi:drug/metabolite transporter, DME family
MRARLLVVSAAILFSTGGAAIKGTTLTAWQVAGLRSLIAAAALLIVLPEARRHWSRRNAIVGLAYAATLILFVTANKLTTSANAIFLQSTAPLYILLASPWLLREPISRRDLILLGVMAAGLALFFVDEVSAVTTAPDPARGNVVAVLSGVAWAATLIGLRWIGRTDPHASMNTVVVGNLWAVAIAAAGAWPIAGATTSDWVGLLWLGVFQIGLAYLCLARGVREVPAFEASLLLLAEPVLNPVWAWVVHGERPGRWAIAGGLLILAATTMRAVTDNRRARLDTRSSLT